MKELNCHRCYKLMGKICDGSMLRKGIVVYCAKCHTDMAHKADAQRQGRMFEPEIPEMKISMELGI